MIVKSPINYTGNKYSIITQIKTLMDTKDKVFVDMCAGGSTVGINIIDAKEVHFIEKNKTVIELLSYIGYSDIEKFISCINKQINKYKLSNSSLNGTEVYRKYRVGNIGLKQYNNDGFLKLRADYNSLKNKSNFDAYVLLYLLIIYGFNNEIRFNKKGEFNIPCGKTDFNKNNLNKLLTYNKLFKKHHHNLHNLDCFSEEAKKIYAKADIIYVDPPYLITTAGYNENNGWSEKEEVKLLNLIEELSVNGKTVYLSNVLRSDDRQNTILIDWIKKNKENITVHEIEKHYRSASYNKIKRGISEEVLIEVKIEN